MEVQATDFLGAFENIDESQKLIKETVRKFVTEKFLPQITENFEKGYYIISISIENGGTQVRKILK